MATIQNSPSSGSDQYDSSRILHEAAPTLVNTSSSFSTPSPRATTFGIQRESAPGNWVPNPADYEFPSRPRTLVLCFDGTGDQFDDDNSNVIQFLSCLKKDNQSEQLVYYQAGIGTYTKSTFVTPITNKVSKMLDEAVAWNLSTHVQEGYEFLMQNYTAGDKLCIFGFSRGAYTARALAGMVQKVGLLPPYNHAQIPFAWAMYTREDKDGLINSVAFKKTFSTDVIIDFLGVWDTVASVGIIARELPFTGTNSAIKVFRHALALDEHRVKFLPNFYHSDPLAGPRAAQTAGSESLSLIPKTFSSGGGAIEAFKKKKLFKHRSDSQMFEAAVNANTGIQTDALEVWFAGCHCDIGGGSVRNGTRNSLARIPLRWMIRECFRAETGIIFNKDLLKEHIGLDADTLYPIVKPRPPRLPAPPGACIAKAEVQGSTFVEFFWVMGELIAIPLTFVARVIAFPIEHFCLLLKFTRLGKAVRYTTKRAWKAIKSVCKSKKADHQPTTDITTDIIQGVKASDFKSEEEEELADALSPIYDQLALAWFWWILEIIPFRFREQKGRRDDYFVRANFGQGRKIYGDAKRSGIKVHRSVKTRLEVVDGTKSVYKPRAWFKYRPEPGNKKVKKVSGPQEWNVDEPDERLWRWVE